MDWHDVYSHRQLRAVPLPQRTFQILVTRSMGRWVARCLPTGTITIDTQAPLAARALIEKVEAELHAACVGADDPVESTTNCISHPAVEELATYWGGDILSITELSADDVVTLRRTYIARVEVE